MKNSKIVPRTLEFYEIDNDLLIKHHLVINDDFRRRNMFGYESAFCSKVIWPTEDSPFNFSYQYDWIKEEDRPWKKTRPFEDLLKPGNTKAVTRISDTELENYEDIYRLPCVFLSSFQTKSRITRAELWGIISPQEFIEIYDDAEEAFSNGRIMSQPIVIEDMLIDENDEYVGMYFLPTHEYIDSKSIEGRMQGRAIMPGIIGLSQDLYLSQLIDIGHYARFISESKRLMVDKDTLNLISYNYKELSQEQIKLSSIPEKEKAKVLRKAKKDSILIDYIKSTMK